MVVRNGWPQRLIRVLLARPGASGVIPGWCRRRAGTHWSFVGPMDSERFKRRSSKVLLRTVRPDSMRFP
jgi:hypothetical protein